MKDSEKYFRRLSDAIQAVKTHWKRYWGIYVCRGELFRCPWRYFRKKGGSCKENKVMAIQRYRRQRIFQTNSLPPVPL